MRLFWDLETYSETPIKFGSHKYAETAEILLFAWAVDDGPVEVWDVCEDSRAPYALLKAAEEAGEYWGHGSGMFDRVIINRLWPHFLDDRKHRDTMAQALSHGLPGSLDSLCSVFKLPEDVAKNKRGKQLIQMFCKPRPVSSKIRRYTKNTHPEEWEEFKQYAKSDITSMRILHSRMPKWNYPNNTNELNLWVLDQKINQRGLYVDVELAEKAIGVISAAQKSLSESARNATKGEVDSATQRDALLQYISRNYGIHLPNMQSGTLQKALARGGLPVEVQELLELRIDASSTASSKYKTLLSSVSRDGYLRGVIQFCGASRTGRDAGRLFQPQNLMRPTMSHEDIEEGIQAIKGGYADLIYENPIDLCSNAVRGTIVSPPGEKLVVADLSNIEGRVLAWLAEEEWKIQAFRDYDTGTGTDLYIAAYCKAFNCRPEEAKRQIGKVMELALGYEGGVGAFVKFSDKSPGMLDKLEAPIPKDVLDEAENFLNWFKEEGKGTHGLKDKTFIMCDSLKRLWRRGNSSIASFWPELKESAIIAIANEGKEVTCRKVSMVRNGNWFKIKLPSGRYLSYPSPKIVDGAITYMGSNQFTRKWERVKTYGGKLAENITQAVARDVFKNCYAKVEELGYKIVLPVHDELITYAPDTPEYNPDDLARIMSVVPSWAEGLPLAAAGFEGLRYRKD